MSWCFCCSCRFYSPNSVSARRLLGGKKNNHVRIIMLWYIHNCLTFKAIDSVFVFISVSSVAVSLCFCSVHTSGGVLCTPAQPRAISTLSAESRLNEELVWCLLMFAVSLNTLWLSAETCPFIAALVTGEGASAPHHVAVTLFEWVGGTFGWLPLSKTMSVRNKRLEKVSSQEQTHGNPSTLYCPSAKMNCCFHQDSEHWFAHTKSCYSGINRTQRVLCICRCAICVVVCGATVPPVVKNL